METVIFAWEDRNGVGRNRDCEGCSPMEGETKYIRADIVTKLKGYAVHGLECRYWSWDPRTWQTEHCTCGLTEVLKEISE